MNNLFLIFLLLIPFFGISQNDQMIVGKWKVINCDMSNTTAPDFLKQKIIEESLSTTYTFKLTDSLNYAHLKSHTVDSEGDWIIKGTKLMMFYSGELNGFKMSVRLHSYNGDQMIFKIPAKENEYILETLKKIP